MTRAALDGLYRLSAILACIAFASIAVLVVLQVLSRLLGFHVAGLVDYATYAMVAATFLGLAATLRRGAHIRVTLLLFAATGRARRGLEVVSLAIASLLMSYFAWFAIRLAFDSWRFGLKEMGLAATPLWVPQSAMAIGAVVAAIAFIDELVVVLFGRPPSYEQGQAAAVLGEPSLGDAAGLRDPAAYGVGKTPAPGAVPSDPTRETAADAAKPERADPWTR